MARRKLIRQKEFPYHVTSRTNQKTWFAIPIFEVWDFCKESLRYATSKKPVITHCFVLMGNHYHLLISTPDENIDEFMMLFNRKLSNLINAKTGLINHKFSNRYKWTIVENESYLLNVYRYIYQNPVRAGISANCKSYPYSSLYFSRWESQQFNYRPHIIYSKEKSWLERRQGEDFDKVIRTNLTKQHFRLNSKGVSNYHRMKFLNPRL